ncbi:hypothetical protein DV736_g6523, partial [Chaetothyriales sp. CBS 134916]
MSNTPFIKSEPDELVNNPNRFMHSQQVFGNTQQHFEPGFSDHDGGSIDPSALSMANGNFGMQYGFGSQAMSSSFNMGSSAYDDSELLESLGGDDFGSGGQNVMDSFSPLQQQQPQSMPSRGAMAVNTSTVYSHTPDGPPIQSPYLGQVDYNHFRTLSSLPQHMSPSQLPAFPTKRPSKTLSGQYGSSAGSWGSHGRESPLSSLGNPLQHPGIEATLGGKHATQESVEAKKRRRRASHNAVERRRRDNINERIQDLSHLVPQHRLDDDRVKKQLASAGPLSPTMAPTGMSPPNANDAATSLLAGASGRRAASTAGNITLGLPMEEREKGPNKGDILNGAVGWTRDLMWALQQKYAQEDELAQYIASIGGSWPFGITEDEKRMRTEVLDAIEKNGIETFSYSRTDGSGLRVPKHTTLSGEKLTTNNSSLSPQSNFELSPGFHSGGSGANSSNGPAQTTTYWHSAGHGGISFKEEDELMEMAVDGEASGATSTQTATPLPLHCVATAVSVAVALWLAPVFARSPHGPPPPGTHDGLSSNSNSLHVKASHATSDSPEPASILAATPISDHEPKALAQLEDRLSLPAEFDPTALEHLSSSAERIGYLKQVCGLDYGWGTSTLMQSLFEYCHIYTGLSWTASIMAVTLLVRVALIKFTLDAQRLSSRMREIQPVLAPLRERYNAAAASGDRTEAIKVAQQIRAVSREANVGIWPILKPMVFQIPLSFGGFRCLRGAALVPVPALETESFLHHTNMAMADPALLPAAGALLTFLAVSKSIKTNPGNSQLKSMQFLLKYVLPGASLIFMHWQPAAVQVYFLTQTAFSCSQTYLLANDRFRGLIGLPSMKVEAAVVGGAGASVGGLNTRPKKTADTIDTTARAAQADTSSAGPNHISGIDKAVNKVKANWAAVIGTGKERQTKRATKTREASAERREYAKRQEIESEREYRNQNARDAFERQKRSTLQQGQDAADEKIGGMKIRKKN